MIVKVNTATSVKKTECSVVLVNDKPKWNSLPFNKKEVDYVKGQLKGKSKIIQVNRLDSYIYLIVLDKKATTYLINERIRQLGYYFLQHAHKIKTTSATVENHSSFEDASIYFAEGLTLSSYAFTKYKSKVTPGSLKQLTLVGKTNKQLLGRIMNAVDGTVLARDLVNEPLSYLTAEQLAKDVSAALRKVGCKVEVFNKKKIESNKMGGLLAVNKGGFLPPTFTIAQWKPKNAKNKKPIVLVGKGIVYDTGGLSLKPTYNSMDKMKSDMGGAATVAGALLSIAKSKVPLHVIALIPASENRPGNKAYAPGDVIKMHSGKRVEVLNTDAEGRLVLADALSYAKRYKPELVLDFATLTGAAARAIGPYGIVYMGTADQQTKSILTNSGETVYERLVEFPIWDEYDDLIISDVADIKNTGGVSAGAITAGKFLQHFVDYPWLHFDIAGTTFIDKKLQYRPKNATGIGVRLLTDFLIERSNAKSRKSAS